MQSIITSMVIITQCCKNKNALLQWRCTSDLRDSHNISLCPREMSSVHFTPSSLRCVSFHLFQQLHVFGLGCASCREHWLRGQSPPCMANIKTTLCLPRRWLICWAHMWLLHGRLHSAWFEAAQRPESGGFALMWWLCCLENDLLSACDDVGQGEIDCVKVGNTTLLELFATRSCAKTGHKLACNMQKSQHNFIVTSQNV